MGASALVVGREREFAQAVDALSRGRGVQLVGPAGVGKSRLADGLAGWAEDSGHAVVRVRATSGSSELPLGAFVAQLGRAERFLTPMFAEIRDRIREQAEGRPVLLSVDDVDLLDDASAVLVHQLVSAGEATLVATLRSGRMASAELVDLVQRGDVLRMEVGTFDRSATATVAEAILGRPLDDRGHERLWALSRGNALFVHELITNALERGHVADGPDGTAVLAELPVDAPRLADVVRGRLTALDPAAHQALLHLAFAEPCGPAELASVADASTLAALEAAELVSGDLDGNRLVLRISHPLYGEVLRSGTGHLQRRAVLATLARDLQATGARRRADVVKLARLAVDGGVSLDPQLLSRAASISYHAGDLVLAERISRQAFDATSGFLPGLDLANSLTALGELEEARRHMDDWRSVDQSSGAQMAVAMVESQLDFWVAGDLQQSRATVAAALERVPADDPGTTLVTRDEVLANQAVHEAVAANFAEAWRLAEPLLAHGPDQVLIRASLAAAHALRINGRSEDAIDVLARAFEAYSIIGQEAVSLSERLILSARSMCRLSAGDADGAKADAEAALANAVNEAQIGIASLALAAAEVFAGRAAAARPHVEHAASLWSRTSGAGVSRRWVLAVSALVHASLGDVATAERWLAEFEVDTHPARVFDFGAHLARARLLLAKGFPEDARTALRDALPAARERADQASESALLYELLRLDRADEVADRLAELAVGAQGRQFAAMDLHARGLRGGDAELLAEAAGAFAASGLHLYASEAYAHGADAARRAGDQRTATRLLGLAADERAQCDVVVTQASIVDIGPVALTRREREIAMLAAQGLASKEIGERLFISRRTAENHLAKVYDKLGVRTRAELARVMDGGVAALAS